MNFNCNNTDWDEKASQFKKSYSNYSQANLVLTKIRERALKIVMDFKLNDVDFTLEQFEEIEQNISRYLVQMDVADRAEPEVSTLRKIRLKGKIKALKEAVQKIKGVGAKSAQRIVLELKDKMIKAVDGAEHLSMAQGNTNKDEALSALVALGFQRNQAEKTVDKVMAAEGDAAAVEQIIKLALKAL